MLITVPVFYPDGTVTYKEKEFPDGPAQEAPYIPTTEDRLDALEKAMLAMMGVSTDV